ncbi:MAG: FGGY family carbohydrate kinase [Acidimicrobiales bacterium]
MGVVIAIDAGTTGIRSLIVDEHGAVSDVSYRELTQHFPRPGWVEHDAEEIWGHVQATLSEVAVRLNGRAPAAIGITNQRETVVAWDRSTGAPLHRAIVWQDRRTSARCEELRERGHLDAVRATTGLVLDPYFSATKMEWLLTEGGLSAISPKRLALGTVDAWVLWKLTGGAAFATDVSNASRTLLLDIGDCRWSAELGEVFGVPLGALPEVRPSSGRIGEVAGSVGLDHLAGTPISGVAGDQQAALFGQACFDVGMAKATYGTGSFVLTNVGSECPAPTDGLLTTLAWDLGDRGAGTVYALEGSTFVSGAAIQWLRDELGIIERAEQMGPLAESVPDSGGVTVVPAFTGLGSPWWDPAARGAILGLTRGAGRAQLARAVVESIAYSVRAMVEATGQATVRPTVLRADGGAAAMDLLLQLQADQLRIPVARPASIESTALGAAMLAGLAEGVWGSTEELSSLWRLDAEFTPGAGGELVEAPYAAWLRSVDRARHWVPA